MRINFASISIKYCLALSLSMGLILSPAQSKEILLIESYHADYPWDASYLEGLKQNLPSQYTLTTFEMDTKRLPSDQHQAQADKAWALYQQKQPILVILGDDNALKFLGKKFVTTSTPVVYLGANNNPRTYGVGSSPNVTGVLERPLVKRSMLLISEIIPMKKVLALFDDGTTAQVVKSSIFSNKNSLNVASVNVDLELMSAMKDIKAKIEKEKSSKTYDAIFMGLYHTIKDAEGNNVPADGVLHWVANNSPVPVFAFWDFTVGKGKAAGGYVLFGKEQGTAAAGLVVEMLKKKSNDIIPPIMGEKGRYLFSNAQLAKWNIQLPETIKQSATLID
jgi:ABC-type uncharacterized transport system substrate-binding protein